MHEFFNISKIHFVYYIFLSEYQTQQLEVNLARHAGQHEQTHEII